MFRQTSSQEMIRETEGGMFNAKTKAVEPDKEKDSN